MLYSAISGKHVPYWIQDLRIYPDPGPNGAFPGDSTYTAMYSCILAVYMFLADNSPLTLNFKFKVFIFIHLRIVLKRKVY